MMKSMNHSSSIRIRYSFYPRVSYIWKASAEQEMAILFSQARFWEFKLIQLFASKDICVIL